MAGATRQSLAAGWWTLPGLSKKWCCREACPMSIAVALVFGVFLLAVSGSRAGPGGSHADAHAAALVYSTASNAVVQHQPAPGSCHAVGSGLYSRPDPRCTPGALDPAVKQANINQTICRSGWTETVRPPEYITEAEKRLSLDAYGDRRPIWDYEYDHFVPLELGGATNDPRNLWPEPGASPNPKDAVENYLNRAVCDHTMTLARAQAAIVANWVAIYRAAARALEPQASGGPLRKVQRQRPMEQPVRRLRRLCVLQPARHEGDRDRSRHVGELVHRQLGLRRRLFPRGPLGGRRSGHGPSWRRDLPHDPLSPNTTLERGNSSAPARRRIRCGPMSRTSRWLRLPPARFLHNSKEHQMSSTSTTESARVVEVAAGLESTGRRTPVRDARHLALDVLIGRWINEGRTIAAPGIPSVPILTGDVYEFAPGGFFVVHFGYGKIGETSVGGVEICRRRRRRVPLDVLRQLRQRARVADGDRRGADQMAR